MLDPAHDLQPPPSSPTASSISSSDLDTESTGSFFRDRSTTLGTLMGVNFPAITFRAPSRSHSQHRQLQTPTTIGPCSINVVGSTRKNKKKSKKSRAAFVADEEERSRWRRRRRRWWGLCRDDCVCRPSSLGEYLEVERRSGDGGFYGGASAEFEGVGTMDVQPANGGRLLFADGRVLPPAEVDEAESPAMDTGSFCRFSAVSLTGICNGRAVG